MISEHNAFQCPQAIDLGQFFTSAMQELFAHKTVFGGTQSGTFLQLISHCLILHDCYSYLSR